MEINFINSEESWESVSFQDQFKKIIKHYKRIGCYMVIVCMPIYKLSFYSHGSSYCMTVDQALDSVTTLTKNFHQ